MFIIYKWTIFLAMLNNQSPMVIYHSHGSHGPFIDDQHDDLPIKNGDSPLRYVKNNQRINWM